MSEEGRELVAKIHRQEIDRYQAQKEKERALVEAMFREAREQQRKKEEEELALEEHRNQPREVAEPPTIHYTELPPADPDSPIRHEWDLYRREVGRLLAEGHEGRFVLIKGDDIIGIWDTGEEAKKAALEKFLLQHCLIHQIRSREPLLRGPRRFWQCRD